MARRRRIRRKRSGNALIALCALAGVGLWWLIAGPLGDEGLDDTLSLDSKNSLATNRLEAPPADPPQAGSPEEGSDPPAPAPGANLDTALSDVNSLIAAARQAEAGGNLVAARDYLNEALAAHPSSQERALLEAELTRLGIETIFSTRLFENDPHTTRFLVRPGDTLARIAAPYNVSDDLIARINGIRNKNLIRVGQALKIIKGPFRAVIDAAAFSLDVYLGNTLVKHYCVGLGVDGSTPRGEWRVSTKLKNPTYYPPRGGQIIAADDPENPLGERWIGLEGVSGEALGQLRYGIHGTIEPETIGQNASLGCVRMNNEDVEDLYTFLVERHSTVIVK